MKIATFLPNMTDAQEPEQEELNENHIPPKLRALHVSPVSVSQSRRDAVLNITL
jgi:hypothetical protein